VVYFKSKHKIRDLDFKIGNPKGQTSPEVGIIYKDIFSGPREQHFRKIFLCGEVIEGRKVMDPARAGKPGYRR
jgi:hypothetical protein